MKYTLISLLLLLSSCANIGTLGGGPEDKTEPKIIGSNLQKTNFRGRQIVLQFNEYVTLNNPEKNIHIFPRHSKMKFSISHKKLLIQLDSQLRPNTTYSLLIDKGIQDINANNTFVYSTVFSTGPYTDSSFIKIRIKDFNKHKHLKICLTEDDGLDSFKTFQSDYILDVQSETIEFTGLSKKSRNIWLFTDENSDMKPDHYKPCDFILSARVDSVYDLQPVLWMKPFEIKNIQTDGRYNKIFYHTQFNYQSSLPNYLNTPAEDFIYYTSDSSVLKANNKINFNRYIDTVTELNYKKDLIALLQSSFKLIQTKNQFLFSYKTPQYYQKLNQNMGFQTNWITYKTKPDSFILYSDKHNSYDSFSLETVVTQDWSKLSYLNLTITDSIPALYDIRLIKDDQEFLFLNAVKQYDDYLEPGTYKIEIYKQDYLYRFNPFVSQKSEIPIYTKSLYLKASWEEILSIKL